jgi:hypothetical protein
MPRFVAGRRLPSTFRSHPNGGGIVAEFDVRPSRHARLVAKVLVFSSKRAMRRFWAKALGRDDLGPRCEGAVNSLLYQYQNPETGDVLRVGGDPRYFCVMGLLRRRLTTEIICHESVHVGFAYHNRVARSPFAGPDDLEEERVAYPAGAVAAAILANLSARGWLLP